MKDPRAVEPSPPDFRSCFVRFVHLRTQLWFATELNVSFDGLHKYAGEARQEMNARRARLKRH